MISRSSALIAVRGQSSRFRRRSILRSASILTVLHRHVAGANLRLIDMERRSAPGRRERCLGNTIGARSTRGQQTHVRAEGEAKRSSAITNGEFTGVVNVPISGRVAPA
jgi:hypothetical protein